MEKFRNQGGLSFMLVHFLTEDRTFILEFTTIKKYWDDAKNGGRKSIPLSAFNEDLEVFFNLRYPVHYLDSLNIYLETEFEKSMTQRSLLKFSLINIASPPSPFSYFLL